MRGSLAIACLLAAATGCGTRSLLLMDPPPPTYAWQRTPGADPAPRPASTSRASADAGSVAVAGSGSSTGTALGLPGGVVLSRLPAPHLATRSKTPVATPTSIDAARALVGMRDPRSSLAFALAVAHGVTGARALPDLADGPALVAWATRQGALATIVPGDAAPPDVAPGDLLVFDRAVAGAPASLVAVVLGRDARGVVDILYLGGGVIRVGHVDPTRPKTARDRGGRAVNTYLRHGRDQPPAGTRFLAGALVSARIHLPR